jgi:hypothetical protein
LVCALFVFKSCHIVFVSSSSKIVASSSSSSSSRRQQQQQIIFLSLKTFFQSDQVSCVVLSVCILFLVDFRKLTPEWGNGAANEHSYILPSSCAVHHPFAASVSLVLTRSALFLAERWRRS